MLTMGQQKKRIGVFPASELTVRKNTFDALAELFPLVFEVFDPVSSVAPDACIVLGAKPLEGTPPDIPCYLWEKSCKMLPLKSAQVSFSSWPELHRAIRGNCLTESTTREIGTLTTQSGEIVVAEIDEHPVWTACGLTQRVAMEPPRLGDQEGLYTYFEARRWLDLMPLLHFLRSVCKGIWWEDPPLRACFVLDDPNLHTFKYGHLDFRRVAREAREHNYHVVFATVPADSWYVNADVARLFREESEYISLTTHGVAHTKKELGRVKGDGIPLLSLGLRRLEKFEVKTGLEVGRIMVPPHEAWSNFTWDSMLRLGYEGGCLATEHLAAWNQGNSWPQHWGLGAVSWTVGGFPILPRFAFRDSVAETGIHLAAFLGQPVILKGHHGDCSNGLNILGQRAAVLNELGAQWSNLQTISRTNYKTKAAGSMLRVQMCSRQIHIRIPEYVKDISIERPWLDESEQEPLRCIATSGRISTYFTGRTSGPIEVVPGATVDVSAVPKEPVDYRNVTGGGISLWAVVRRVLAEGRDRLLPLLPRKSERA